MMQTVQTILDHLESLTDQPRLVLWAHNSHVGDASATELGERGQLTVGGLVKRRYGEDAVGVGFTTYSGEVLAASGWGQDAQLQDVRPALDESYEGLFHDVATSGADNIMLPLDKAPLAESLGVERLERAIGVIYSPATERISHYLRQSSAASSMRCCISTGPMPWSRSARHRQPRTNGCHPESNRRAWRRRSADACGG